MKPRKRRGPAPQPGAQPPIGAPKAAVPAANDRATTIAVCIFLAVITLVLYGRVQQFEFINLDDTDYASENRFVQQGLTRESLVWAFTGTQVRNWHPITSLSLVLNRQFFGAGPGGFHVVNLLLHMVNTVLLFWVLNKMTGALWRSAAVAALFAWHPLHIQSVAWVSERKDVLSGLFWLLAIWSYVRFVERPQPWRYILTLFLFALGLLSKPMVVTLPFVLLLLDWWPLRRTQPGAAGAPPKTWARLTLEKIPFFVLAAISSVITFLVQKRGGAVATMERFTLGERAANAAVSYQRYLEKTLWPGDLSVVYPYPGSWPLWRVAGALVLLLVVSAVVVRWSRRAPYLAVGWIWYLGTLVPVIGLVQVGAQSMADRYTYLPLIGIFVMAAWGIDELLGRQTIRKEVPALVAGGALVACLAVTSQQLDWWKNSVSLFDHALKVTSNNGLAQKCLADALNVTGHADEALIQYAGALRLLPNDPELHFTMGSLLGNQGKTDEALREYGEVVRLDPGHWRAFYNQGNIYSRRGQWNEAAVVYAEAVRLQPDSGDARVNLANSLIMQNKLEPAASQYLEALRLNPNYESAHCNVGIILAKQGRSEEAITHFKEALRLKPDFALALDRLAWLRATDNNAKLRDGPEAVRLAEKACAVTGGRQAALLETLAAAYAEAGRMPDAVNTEQVSLALTVGAPPEVIEPMKMRLALYQAGKPYREQLAP